MVGTRKAGSSSCCIHQLVSDSDMILANTKSQGLFGLYGCIETWYVAPVFSTSKRLRMYDAKPSRLMRGKCSTRVRTSTWY